MKARVGDTRNKDGDIMKSDFEHYGNMMIDLKHRESRAPKNCNSYPDAIFK